MEYRLPELPPVYRKLEFPDLGGIAGTGVVLLELRATGAGVCDGLRMLVGNVGLV